MENKDLNKLNKKMKYKSSITIALILMTINLYSQIEIPQLNIRIQNAKALTRPVEKERIIKDSIRIIGYGLILENYLSFSLYNIKSQNAQDLIKPLINEIEQKDVNKFMEVEHSKMYLKENDSIKSIRIVEMKLSGGGQAFIGSYIRKIDSNVLYVFMMEKSEEIIKQKLKFCESLNIEYVD